MDDFEEFLLKQEEIYKKFMGLSAEVWEKGVKRDSFMADEPMSKAGFLVGLMHPSEITDCVNQFCEKLEKTGVPIVGYTGDAVHTTLSKYDVKIIGPDDKNLLDSNISNKLCEAAHSCGKEGGIEIDYSNWLYNPTTIIAEGHPNGAFLQYAKQLKESASQMDIELGLPWGAHMTTARFLEDIDPEQIGELIRLMEEAPRLDGVSRPTHLKVGYFKLNDNEMVYKPIEIFPLKNT